MLVAYLVLSLSVCLDKGVCEEWELNIGNKI